MGIGGISPVQLIIILVIVLLIFGTKKLRGLGGDLGGAIKGFKKAMKDDGSEEKPENAEELTDTTVEVTDTAADATVNKTEEARVDNKSS